MVSCHSRASSAETDGGWLSGTRMSVIVTRVTSARTIRTIPPCIRGSVVAALQCKPSTSWWAWYFSVMPATERGYVPRPNSITLIGGRSGTRVLRIEPGAEYEREQHPRAHLAPRFSESFDGGAGCRPAHRLRGVRRGERQDPHRGSRVRRTRHGGHAAGHAGRRRSAAGRHGRRPHGTRQDQAGSAQGEEPRPGAGGRRPLFRRLRSLQARDRIGGRGAGRLCRQVPPAVPDGGGPGGQARFRRKAPRHRSGGHQDGPRGLPVGPAEEPLGRLRSAEPFLGGLSGGR